MLYVRTEGGTAVEATTKYPEDRVGGHWPKNWQTRNDWPTLNHAEVVASELNAHAGELRYLATDAGPGQWPRYDVIEAPRAGDEISYAYNGDYYPDGEIVKVSDSLRVVYSSTGSKYWRRRATGTWLKDGMWCLVKGHRSERNPHL